jgi:glycosyltransferase involved in cell wall biosynthesis
MLSIIIPIFNEVKTISKIIDRINNVRIPKELIFVDDGSTDGTRDILANLIKSNYIVLFHKHNRGKGAAIRTAIPFVSGDIVIIQDADLEYNPKDYYAIVEAFHEGAEVVYGSRNLLKKNREHSSIVFYWGGVLLSVLATLLYGQKITDQTTCYKALRREVLENLAIESEGFEFCSEITAKVRNNGHSITEVPIDYFPRSVFDGKKIKWRDGIKAAYTLMKYKIQYIFCRLAINDNGAKFSSKKDEGYFAQ